MMPPPTLPTKNIEKPGEFNAAVESASDAVHRTIQDSGKASGAESGSSAAASVKSQAEKAADRLYEERIEDEYAKREGGA